MADDTVIEGGPSQSRSGTQRNPAGETGNGFQQPDEDLIRDLEDFERNN